MKNILSTALTLIILLTILTGCQPTQTDYTPYDSENTPAPEVTTGRGDSGGDNTSHEDTTTSQEGNTTLPEDTTEQSPKPDTPSSPDNTEEPLFKYNKYMVTADARNYMSEREYFLYCQMIDSILAHNGVVSGFESYAEFNKVLGFLLREFIPIRSIIQTYLVSNTPFSYDDGTATFKFVGDKKTCDENYAKFENIMNEALSLIEEDDSNWERITKLYLYVSEHMIYGNPYETYGLSPDLYTCIVYKIGMCTDYAYYLNMLANQIGFETIDARSLGKNGFEGADHAWSMILVDGNWYHFDACWQAALLVHDNLDYFAINTKDRYNSLAANNMWGQAGEVELFDQHDFTNERSPLPYCENAISEDERQRLFLAVIGDYRKCLSNDIPSDMIDNYIDEVIAEVQEDLDNGATVGIKFEIKNGTLNSAVSDLIICYSPEDLQDYPELEYGADRCTILSVVLEHIDQSDLRAMIFFILQESIVVDQSVKLVVI